MVKRSPGTVAPASGSRRFLFLQGPHGPFFHRLARGLRAAGAAVTRVGFNAGDRAFWFGADGYVPFRGRAEDWPETLTQLLDDRAITDIVLYGDTRPVHAAAVAEGQRRGLTVHVFEEGYLRPYWVTYERGGSNGHSQLMTTTIAEMADALGPDEADLPNAPTGWGEMRQHVFYGALYHWFVLFRNGDYPGFRSHRTRSVWNEARLYTRRLTLMPYHALQRWLSTRRIKRGAFPYHIALLQLDHDASFIDHSPFETSEEFLSQVLRGFAKGAPGHHHLVFKAHPLDHGGAPHRRIIRDLTGQLGLTGRVHYVRGGKLARLLDPALSAVTVNSTAGQQALWRGLPLMSFGRAVYCKPGLVAAGPVDAFFADPPHPDVAAYRVFRRYLLATCQIPGGFYSARGRRRLTRRLVDAMLAERDPYQSLRDQPHVEPSQPLRLVR